MGWEPGDCKDRAVGVEAGARSDRRGEREAGRQTEREGENRYRMGAPTEAKKPLQDPERCSGP